MADTGESFEAGRVRIKYAAWEKRFDKVVTPFERFVKHQATGGLLLMFTAFVALVLANPPLRESYVHLLHTSMGFQVGELANPRMAALPIFAAVGVAVGLIGGKLIGIVGFSWVAIKSGVASLPESVRMSHITGAAFLGSIGFTMSIFIAELAFANQPEMIMQAKLGILVASLLAGFVGYAMLHRLGEKPAR